jgi:hypothetical protein
MRGLHGFRAIALISWFGLKGTQRALLLAEALSNLSIAEAFALDVQRSIHKSSQLVVFF